MAEIKSLAKDTAIYGLSSIVGKFLNYFLTPVYTYSIAASAIGVHSNLYAYNALLLTILTYGMETGFFRFINKSDNPKRVYSTTLISIAATSLLFVGVIALTLNPVSAAIGYPDNKQYVMMMAVIVAIDAFVSIPFSYLRYLNKPWRFAGIRLLGIAINIILNLIVFLPIALTMTDGAVGIDWLWFSKGMVPADYAVISISIILGINVITSVVLLIMLAPELTCCRYLFDFALWKKMIAYSFPLLILGIAGIMNSTIDKILYPYLGGENAMADLGIYNANFKIGIILVMFTHAFRFAYEPYVFAQARNDGNDKRQAYADAMKYFIIFTLFIFLTVICFLDIIKYIIAERFHSGLAVVPVVMLAELFFGITFNLSFWYKLSDRTIWGTWFSLLGLAITIVLNVALVPRIGYMGCAWASVASYGIMMFASYFVGQAKYPIPYAVGQIIVYFAAAAAIFAAMTLVEMPSPWLGYLYRSALLILFGLFALRFEHIKLSRLIPRRRE